MAELIQGLFILQIVFKPPRIMLLLESVPDENVSIFTHSDSLSLILTLFVCLFVCIIALRKDKTNTHTGAGIKP